LAIAFVKQEYDGKNTLGKNTLIIVQTDVKYQLAAIAATIENFLDYPQESKEMSDS